MIESLPSAAMLWTGGKDSSMALYEASLNGYGVCCLVTFAPPEPDFLAHPLDLIKRQAQTLALPHYVLTIREPFEHSYEAELLKLKDEMGIDYVITGDIAQVNGNANWIRQRCLNIGMKVHIPLWGRDRNTLMQQLLDRGFKVRLSCVNTGWLDQNWVGRELNETALEELRFIARKNGMDLCGEEGEYHTMVVDGPQFKQGINILSYSTAVSGELAYMKIQGIELNDLSLIRKAQATLASASQVNNRAIQPK